MWQEYFKKHLKRKPREQLVRAVSFCNKKENSLDLGAGTLIESKFLIKKGFKKVVAVDSAKEVKKFVEDFNNKKLEFHSISFQEFLFEKDIYDLINAQFALPFYGSTGFNSFIKKIKSSLKKDGIFVGELFGKKDSWNNKDTELVFHTKQQALSLFKDLEIIEFIEEEKDGLAASGVKKHWHIFHFILRKK
ncbi:MAG: class I SAM-dependent methyltransferase [Patescibacteria group bacterium]